MPPLPRGDSSVEFGVSEPSLADRLDDLRLDDVCTRSLCAEPPSSMAFRVREDDPNLADLIFKRRMVSCKTRKFSVSKPSGMFAKKKDILNVESSDGSASDMFFKRFKGKQDFLLLYDSKKSPRALCLEEASQHSLAYMIYGRQPLHDGDNPMEKIEGRHFYPWFRLFLDANGLGDRCRYIQAWDGGNFVTLWVVSPPDEVSPFFNETKLHMAALENMDEIRGTLTHMQRSKRKGWDVEVARHVDPSLFLCLAAILV